MDSKKEIVPWICHVCDKEFNVNSGGLCSNCHKATRLKCLGIGTFFGISKQAKVENNVCRHCAVTDEDRLKEDSV